MTIPETERPSIWNDETYCLEPGQLATAMVHLYRAEVARSNLWRNRLDTTTNWAVVTAGAALTFTFSSPDHPHFVVLLVLLLILTFLLIEARRYSYYAIWYYRVRLLEVGFFAAITTPPYQPTVGWGDALHEALSNPSFVTPNWRSAAVRYRRNYIWLVSLVLISWLLKLSIHPVSATSVEEVVARASIGTWVSGPWVMAFVALIYVGLLGLLVAAYLFPARDDRHPRGYRPGGAELISPDREQMAIIITNRKEAIASRLMQELRRGVTALTGTGMYTGHPRDVLFCALTRAQEAALKEIVTEADPDAFVILTGARDVRGKGFAPVEPPT